MYFFLGQSAVGPDFALEQLIPPSHALPEKRRIEGERATFLRSLTTSGGFFSPPLPSFATRRSTHNSVRKKRRREGIEEIGAGGIIY